MRVGEMMRMNGIDVPEACCSQVEYIPRSPSMLHGSWPSFPVLGLPGRH